MNAARARRLFGNPMAMSEYMAKHWREHAPADVLAAVDAAEGDRHAMAALVGAGGMLGQLRTHILNRQLCIRWHDGPKGRICTQKRSWGLSEEATLEAHRLVQHRVWIADMDRKHAAKAEAENAEAIDQAQVERLHKNGRKRKTEPKAAA